MLDKARGRQLEYDTPSTRRSYNRERPASPFESSPFPAMPITTTVLVNNIAVTTTDAEIQNFFGFWFVSLRGFS